MSRLLRSMHKYIHTIGMQRNMPDAGRGQGNAVLDMRTQGLEPA